MQCSVYCVHGIKYSILCSGSRVLGAEYCVVGNKKRVLDAVLRVLCTYQWI